MRARKGRNPWVCEAATTSPAAQRVTNRQSPPVSLHPQRVICRLAWLPCVRGAHMVRGARPGAACVAVGALLMVVHRLDIWMGCAEMLVMRFDCANG